MNKNCISIFLAITIAGCATADRGQMSDFEIIDDENEKVRFRFDARTATLVYPDNEEGEAIRMDWLRYYLDINEICQSGFTITSRKATTVGTTLTKEKPKRIVYYGECQ